MNRLSQLIDTFTTLLGKTGSFFSGLLLFLIIFDVFLRFLFSVSVNYLLELEWHFFGLIFLLGGGSNILNDKHVRVDFFYELFSARKKEIINLVFHILFLVPWSLVGIYTCFNYASNSFYIRETSPNPGGLAAIYPIKYAVVFCFVFILLQGLSEIFKTISRLKNTWNTL
ncbi:MAG: TRAP transporter small permease subunit [Saprospiraceae bacterium]|nr:TRAP transporter small permease subunit [Saprospiraceae bacterium]MBK8370629.1 TRAP transporter small permease subunit [Saprospiraceae bacterium]MBK8854519.1 TRAP transporter small permease subunit [Saprospiraceae bacterium]MBK9044525.1 TRAP transporter small permease subunit [Saprospiraceae bacterium]